MWSYDVVEEGVVMNCNGDERLVAYVFEVVVGGCGPHVGFPVDAGSCPSDL